MTVADDRAYGTPSNEQDIADFRALFTPQDYLLACPPTGGQIIGITGHYPFAMTVPGGARIDVAGVSWVSVAAPHRRRGVLRTMMTAQHQGFVEDGIAVTILRASQGGIYGRFGYGPATTQRSVEIDRRLVAFRPGAANPGGVRQADAAEARRHAPDVHRRWCARTPGALERSPAWWDFTFLDREHRRHGGSALFHLVHPDGWAAYRVEENSQHCRVVELVAATDQAHLALWQVLLGLDLIRTVATEAAPLDDPLPFQLTDPRQVRTVGLSDGLWLRLLDVPAALSARRYGTELEVVLEVHDPLLGCGGRFRLRGGPDGACCEPTDRLPEAHAQIAALGSLYLGGHRAQSLARTDLLQATDPAVVQRMDTAFAAERDPQPGTDF